MSGLTNLHVERATYATATAALYHRGQPSDPDTNRT